MRLTLGDKYTPGERPWYTALEKDDVVVRQSEDHFEKARFNKNLIMEEVGIDDWGCRIYQITTNNKLNTRRREGRELWRRHHRHFA